MRKNAELTTQQLVVIIVLITSFAILLFFLFRLNLTETTEKELCYNSVVLRGNSVLPKDAVSLNCHRSYVCITSDGTCEKMTKPKILEVKTKDDVYRSLANEMADCWWMFGEGKINYVGSSLIPDLYCSLCSQVAFDDSVKESIFAGSEFNKKELYEFLSREKISGKGVTYSNYLFGANDFVSKVKENFGKVNLDKQYYVMMGITSEVSKLGWAGVVAGAITGMVYLPIQIGIAVGVVAVVAGGVDVADGATYVGSVVKGSSGNDYLSPSLVEIGSKEYESLKCKSIETLS